MDVLGASRYRPVMCWKQCYGFSTRARNGTCDTIDPACPSECQCRHGQSQEFARSDLKVDCRAIS